MGMTIEQLVKIEADNLRKYATEWERSKLDFDKLQHNSPTRCIYGQMVGYCYNTRACYLIEKCSPVFYESQSLRVSNEKLGSSVFRRYSAIESYISWEGRRNLGEGNRKLIAYLKGETDTLDL